MVNVVIVGCAAVAVAYVFVKVAAWRRNFKLAETTHFPTFYAPVSLVDVWWVILYPYLTPLVQLLLPSGTNPWLPLSRSFHIWDAGHVPFANSGTSTLMLATPSQNLLWTCSPSLIKQILTSNTVHMPVDMMRFFDVFGPTVGSVEGEEWKAHRKVVNQGLNPSTLPAVWKETVRQTEGLLAKWEEGDGEVGLVRTWTVRLALHVLSGVFFGREMEWASFSPSSDTSPRAEAQEKISGGEEAKMSFGTALSTLISRIGLKFIISPFLLPILPFKATKETHRALTDFSGYMSELRSEALSSLNAGQKQRRYKTILESITLAGAEDKLSEASVVGNIFFTLMAGHETSGNTLAFALLLLALYPEYQAQIHEQLDKHFGDRGRETWTMEEDYAILQKGYIGHFYKEVLRSYNPVQWTIRRTIAPTILADEAGNPHSIPKDTLIVLAHAAAFQNPSTFPPKRVSAAQRKMWKDAPAIDFDPSRWAKPTDKEEEAFIHWPFGHGGRQCPGRPFAQVEIVAFLATMLKGHMLELVGSRDEAMGMLREGVTFGVTLMMDRELPIRVVKRA